MDRILTVRDSIYEQFQESDGFKDIMFAPEQDDRYAAYYTAMYLIQDTGEAVQSHPKQGFSSDPMMAYVKFWGVTRAIFMQQDAIRELVWAITRKKPDIRALVGWNEIRDFRNLCTGHPAKQTPDRKNPIARKTFMGRGFGDYSQIRLETWDAGSGASSHLTFDLGAMIDAYDTEAEELLDTALQYAHRMWP